MAEYDDEDEDILHVDDITKLYGQNFVSMVIYVCVKRKIYALQFSVIFFVE